MLEDLSPVGIVGVGLLDSNDLLELLLYMICCNEWSERHINVFHVHPVFIQGEATVSWRNYEPMFVHIVELNIEVSSHVRSLLIGLIS